MAALITTIGALFTALLGWIPDLTAVIIADPLLIIPVALMVIGFVVGIIARIFGNRL